MTVVCIGSKTAGRKFINYEIEQSAKRGNAILGIQINHLKDKDGNIDPVGETPAKLTSGKYSVYKYADGDQLKKRIEEVAKAAGK